MKFFKKKPTNTVDPPAAVIGTAGSLREFVYPGRGQRLQPHFRT